MIVLFVIIVIIAILLVLYLRKSAPQAYESFNSPGKEIIPHKIHFMWIDKNNPNENIDYPKYYEKNINSWRRNHKNYEIKIWLGKDCFELISNFLPNDVEKYKQFGLMQKCDFMRFLIVLVHGGFYSDLDIISRLPMRKYIDSLFYFEPKQHRKNLIITGFFGGIANHPFIQGWIKNMLTKKYNLDPMKFGGPEALFKYYKKAHKNLINIGDLRDLSPFLKTGEYIGQGKYNIEKAIIWWETTSWGQENDKIGTKSPPQFVVIKNPLNGQDIIWEEDLKKYEKNDPIKYVFVAQAFPSKTIYLDTKNDEIEQLCLLNMINNLIFK